MLFSDLLTGHRVITDDREAEEVVLRWHGTSTDVVVQVERYADGLSRHQRSAAALAEAS